MVDTAHIRKEQHMVMGGGHVQRLHIVLLLQVLGVDTPATPALGTVGIHGHPLDIAVIGDGKGAGLLLDQILNVDLVLDLLNFGFPLVTELVPNGNQLLPQNAFQLLGVCKQFVVVADALLQLVVFVLQLLPVKALQGFQAHIQNGLGLDFVQSEPLTQPLSGIVIGGADDADNLVNIVLGDGHAPWPFAGHSGCGGSALPSGSSDIRQ